MKKNTVKLQHGSSDNCLRQNGWHLYFMTSYFCVNTHGDTISENTVKFLRRDLAKLTSRIYCNSQHDALMKFLSYDESYWPERISHNFLI